MSLLKCREFIKGSTTGVAVMAGSRDFEAPYIVAQVLKAQWDGDRSRNSPEFNAQLQSEYRKG